MKAKYIKRFTILICILVSVAIYFAFNPESFSWFPKCMFHSMTGYDCPGCGSQRAIHSLLHFDLKAAFHYNPLLISIIPYVLLGTYLDYLGGRDKYPKLRRVLFGKEAILILFFIVIAFWLGRNII